MRVRRIRRTRYWGCVGWLRQLHSDTEFSSPRGWRVPVDYVAAEELIREFHSATRPLVLRWLGRQAALAACREARDG